MWSRADPGAAHPAGASCSTAISTPIRWATLTGWSVNPAGEASRDGRLYGRGAADMKGGIAASIVAMAALAEQRDSLGRRSRADAGGRRGDDGSARDQTICSIGSLMQRVPPRSSADAGSPMVLRFGEKDSSGSISRRRVRRPTAPMSISA